MDSEASPQVDPAATRRTAILAILGFAICSLAAAILSRGFLEADGATHYLFARHAFSDPQYFLNVWGRPLCTAIFALPAQLGRISPHLGVVGVRMVSLAAAIGCGWVAMRLAAGQGHRWPALAMIFTLGQPLLFLHSFAELTELPFAFVAGLTLLAYQQQKWGAMAALAAILPLGRPEGFAVLPLVAVVLAFHRQWKWILVLPVGLVIWMVIGHIVVGPADSPWWKWLAVHWSWDSQSQYPPGPLYHFLALLPMVVVPLALPAMWIGMAMDGGEALRSRNFLENHRARVGGMIAGIPLAALIGHSLLFWLGKMASAGEPRYLLIAAPMWGVLSARGWEWLAARFRIRRVTQWAALAAVASGLANYYWRVLPLEPVNDWSEAERFVDWYEHDPQAAQLRLLYPRVMTSHPGILFYMNVDPSDSRRVQGWSRDAIESPPPGVMLLWDPEFAPRNSDARLCVQLTDPIADGWVHDGKAERESWINNPPPWDNPKVSGVPAPPKNATLAQLKSIWHIFLSPRDIDGNPTPQPRAEIEPPINTDEHG